MESASDNRCGRTTQCLLALASDGRCLLGPLDWQEKRVFDGEVGRTNTRKGCSTFVSFSNTTTAQTNLQPREVLKVFSLFIYIKKPWMFIKTRRADKWTTDTESKGTNKHCRWSSVSNSESWLKVFLIQHDIITIPHDPRLNIPWETNSASLKTGSNWSAAKRRHRFNPWRDEGRKIKAGGTRGGRRPLTPGGAGGGGGGNRGGQKWHRLPTTQNTSRR